MTFASIKGQQQAIGRLQGYLSGEKPDGGYLFSGPEGVGKFLSARAFAQAANCPQRGADGDACGRCSVCLRIEKNTHPDIHLIDCGPDEIRIEDIRRLQEEIHLRPYEAAKKVCIINNAHNLNAVSANAFLKTLEEPPADTILILVTDKPQLLLKTIVSRCRMVKFRAMEKKALESMLQHDYGVPVDQVHFLAYFSEGCLGSALRLKDSDIIACKDRVIEVCSSPGASLFDSLATKDRQQLRVYLNILAGWFRDAAFCKAGIPRSEMIHADRLEAISGYAAAHTAAELHEGMQTVSDFLLYLDQNVNVNLLMSNLKLYFQSNR